VNASTDVLNSLSAKEQLGLLLSQDKRKTERVGIPVYLTYTDSFKTLFSPKIQIEDISGGGLKFSDSQKIKNHAVLYLHLYLSPKAPPLTIEGEVIWCTKVPARNKQKYLYNKGVMFHKMNCQDRREFVSFLSNQILSSYLQNQSLLQKQVSSAKSSKRSTP
jgi:Tfp pilus assembly protein PilZ